MGADAVGIYKNPWGPNPPRPKVNKTLREFYRYAVWFKANPRGEDTLRALFDARFPGGRWVNADVDPAAARAALGEERLVLVYPDAIGQGLGDLERAAWRARRGRPPADVLNGRGRLFPLTRGTRWALGVRRLLERTQILELAALGLFLLVTPVLWVWDAARGRT